MGRSMDSNGLGEFPILLLKILVSLYNQDDPLAVRLCLTFLITNSKLYIVYLQCIGSSQPTLIP